MKTFLISYCIILLSVVCLDGAWLWIQFKRFYAPNMGQLLSHSVALVPAGMFYALFALGINVFVVQPGLRHGAPFLHLFLFGMLFGLVAFGTYNLTNQAALKEWPWILTAVDMAWGTVLTGVSTVICAYLMRLFM